MRGTWLSVTMSLLFVSCEGGHSQDEAGTEEALQLFAPQIVSTAGREFATSFTPDGNAVYFNRVDDDGKIPILESRWLDGAWTPPTPIDWRGAFLDVDPFVTSDGRRLFFTTNRNETGDEPSPDFDIWVADREGDAWGQPRRLPSPPNSDASEAFVSVTDSGTLYFGSTNTPSGVRGVLRCERVDGGYGAVEQVDLGLAEGAAAGNPLVLPDESALIFTSRDLPGQGEVDLYISYRNPDGTWTAPRGLAPPINSAFSDFAPGLGPGARRLYFTSERPGIVPEGAVEGRPPGDIYSVPFPPKPDPDGS